jgi:hypothetical protein
LRRKGLERRSSLLFWDQALQVIDAIPRIGALVQSSPYPKWRL